jgi:hypothetical protein
LLHESTRDLMIYPLILVFTILGWMSFLSALKTEGFLRFIGVRAYLAMALMVLALFLQGAAGMAPSVSAKVVFVIAIIGLIYGLFSKTLNLHKLLHPVFVAPVFVLVSYPIFLKIGYRPYECDEFTHWLTMPRQILLWDRLSTTQFPIPTYLEYTPGWPLLIAYPLLLMRASFDPTWTLFVPMLSGIITIAILFDLLALRIGSQSIAWVFASLAGLFGWSMSWIPRALGIEPPLESAFAVIFLTLLFAELDTSLMDSRRKKLELALFVGITLSFGYLLKKTFGIALIAAAALWILLGRNLTWKDRLKHGVLLFAPFIGTLVIWKAITSSYPHMFVINGEKVPRPAVEILFSQDSYQILKGMLLSCVFYLRQTTLAVPLILVGAFSAFKMRRGHRTAIALFLLCVVYFFGLQWLYLTSFHPSQGKSLASIGRYLSTPIRLITLVSFCLGVVWVSQSLLINVIKRRRFPRWINITLWILASSIVAVVWIRTYSRLVPAVEPSPVLREAPELIKVLSVRGLRGSVVQILNQGVDRTTYIQALYASIDQFRSVAYRPREASWFRLVYEAEDRFQHSRVTTLQEFENLVQTADVIWPIKTSDWMKFILQKHIDPAQCKEPTEHYFLLKRETASGLPANSAAPVLFECVRKSSALQ